MVVARTQCRHCYVSLGVLQEPYISLVACPCMMVKMDREYMPGHVWWCHRRYTTRLCQSYSPLPHYQPLIRHQRKLTGAQTDQLQKSNFPFRGSSRATLKEHTAYYSLSCHGLSLQSIYYVLLCSGNTVQSIILCYAFAGISKQQGLQRAKHSSIFSCNSAAYNISRVEKRDISVCLVCSKGREQLRFVVG